MASALFKLNSNDFVRGAITSIVAAVVAVAYGLVYKEGFNLFHTDWAMIGQMMANAAFYAFVGYLGKNWISDADGVIHTPLGKIG